MSSDGPPQNSHFTTRNSLLRDAQQHDPQAWTRLCHLYEPLARYWCVRLGVPTQDLDDVVQDVFASVARGLHKFRRRSSRDSFRAWLRTVTRHRVMDWFRARAGKVVASGGSLAMKRLAEVPDASAELPWSSESEDESRLNDQLLAAALAHIENSCDAKTWQAFWRVVVDGARPVDVAEDLEMPPVSVRVAKCRVLNRLRRELGECES